MSKRTVYTIVTALPPTVTREIGVRMLHDHDEMIELNPLVIEHHPIKPPKDAPAEEFHCAWHSLTDKLSYFPGVKGSVTYRAAFHDMPWGIQTHIYAPMGLEIREKWSIGGNMPGEAREVLELGLKGAPRDGLYLREDCDMKCSVFMTPYVKRQMKKSHEVLVERLLTKGEVIEDREYRDATASAAPSGAGGSIAATDPDAKSPSYTSPGASLASLPQQVKPVLMNPSDPSPPAYQNPHQPPPLQHSVSSASSVHHDPGTASKHSSYQHPPPPPQYFPHLGPHGQPVAPPGAYPYGYPPPGVHPAYAQPMPPGAPPPGSHASWVHPQYSGSSVGSYAPHRASQGPAAAPPGGQQFVAELPHEPVMPEMPSPMPSPAFPPPQHQQHQQHQLQHPQPQHPQPQPQYPPQQPAGYGPPPPHAMHPQHHPYYQGGHQPYAATPPQGYAATPPMGYAATPPPPAPLGHSPEVPQPGGPPEGRRPPLGHRVSSGHHSPPALGGPQRPPSAVQRPSSGHGLGQQLPPPQQPQGQQQPQVQQQQQGPQRESLEQKMHGLGLSTEPRRPSDPNMPAPLQVGGSGPP